MSCPECDEYRQRAVRVEEAEKLLLLFTDAFSRLSKALIDIEAERDRTRYAENPPPEGASPIPKRRYLLMPVKLVGGEIETEAKCTAGG